MGLGGGWGWGGGILRFVSQYVGLSVRLSVGPPKITKKITKLYKTLQNVTKHYKTLENIKVRRICPQPTHPFHL